MRQVVVVYWVLWLAALLAAPPVSAHGLATCQDDGTGNGGSVCTGTPNTHADNSRRQDRVAQMQPRAGASADLAACVNRADNDLSRRVDACTRAIAANLGNATALLQARLMRSTLNTQLRQWDRVVGDCDEVVRLAPEGEIRATAEALRRAALAMLRKSVAGTPGNTPAGAGGGQLPSPAQAATLSPDLAACSKDADDAVSNRIAACTRAIESNPGNATIALPAHLRRALLYQRLKRWDQVVADCDEILRLAPEGEMKSAAGILRDMARGAQHSPPAAAVTQTQPGISPQQWQSLNARVLDALKADDYGEGTAKLAEQAVSVARRSFGDRAPQTLVSLTNLAAVYHRQGRYGDAVPLLQEALQARREGLGPRHPETLTSMSSLAIVYQEQGRAGDAEPLLKETLRVRREVLGARHPDTLSTLNLLANVYSEQGRTGEAEPLYREALQTRRAVLGDRHPDTLASLGNLALLYEDQGRYGEAEPLFKEALQAQREVLGDRNPGTLTTLNNLAILYRLQGRYSEAEPLLKDVVQAKRAAQGARHPTTLAALNNLATVYQDQGRYGEAEPLFKEVLQANREVLGPRHPATLRALTNLAGLYKEQGRYGEAEPLYREALQAKREVLGARHPDTLTADNNIANLYEAEGRYGEAEQLYRQALQAQREVLGIGRRETLTTLNNLAALYLHQGHYGEAEPLFKEALQTRQEALGPRHPDTLMSLNNLANLYQAQGRNSEAEPLFQQALQDSREALGPRHPQTLTAANNLARLYQDQGRYGEAEPLFQRTLQESRDALGTRHPATLISLNNLALLYKDQHRYDEAEPLFREALQASRDVLGARHPQTLTALNNLAVLYDDQKRYDQAEPLYGEALQTRRGLLGNRHPDTLVSLNNMAALYQEQGRNGEAEPLFQEALQGQREVLGSRHPATLNTLNNVAILYDQEGRSRDAEPLYRESVQASREVLGPRHPDSLDYQLSFVQYLVKQNRRGEAVGLLTQMETDLLAWIGHELHNTEAGAARRQLLSSQSLFQDVVLTLATAPGASPEARRLAATTMLQFKVLQGEEEAYLARLARQSSDPRVQTLVTEIVALRQTLAAAAQGAPDAFENTLKALEGKQQELVRISPEYNSRLRVLNASLDEVRRALPAGSALIEFRQFRPYDFQTRKRSEPRFAGLLVTATGEPAVADLGLVSELQPLAAPLSGGIAGRGPAAGAQPQGDPRVATVASRGLAPTAPQPPVVVDETALYQRLIEPFKDTVVAAKAVYVAPDGILNLVPFARLKRPGGHYWFEDQEIHVLQTGRDLLRTGADHPGHGLIALGGIDFDAGAAATGRQDDSFFTAAGTDRKAAVERAAGVFRIGFPPLPATAAEAREVAALYHRQYAGEPAELWSGATASKARLLALKSAPRVLHLATHGFYLPNRSREPMLLSGIALSGANREVGGAAGGGLMFALEAEGLNLDGTELVVLSACDTAKGDVDYSEGVFGLARALRTAGARNVLVTLWPLDDVLARDFMADFYRNWLADGRSDPARALRDTQLQWIRQAGHSDPRAWAPYVVIE